MRSHTAATSPEATAGIGSFPDDLADTFTRSVPWVAGDRSPYVRPEHEATIRRLFPRTTQVTIKHAGHWDKRPVRRDPRADTRGC